LKWHRIEQLHNSTIATQQSTIKFSLVKISV
jgi:hypothetical protein